MTNTLRTIATSALVALTTISCTEKRLEPVDQVKLKKTIVYFTTTGWTTSEFLDSVTFADEVPQDAIEKIFGQYNPNRQLTQTDYRTIFTQLANARR